MRRGHIQLCIVNDTNKNKILYQIKMNFDDLYVIADISEFLFENHMKVLRKYSKSTLKLDW